MRRPSPQLETWDGSTFTVSVVATNETMGLGRAKRWVTRNVAREMEPVSDSATRVTHKQPHGADIVARFHYKFRLKQN